MKTLHAFTRALGLVALLVFSIGTARAGQIELTATQLFTTWNNINGALTVVAASTSMDEDWTARFKAMAPEPTDGKSLADVVAQIHAFHAKLSAVRQAGDPDQPPLTTSVAFGDSVRLSDAYLATGELMDALILLLIKTDPLAFVAQYYAREDVGEKSANDVFSVAALANKRMDVYMTENGIEMPAAPETEAKQ